MTKDPTHGCFGLHLRAIDSPVFVEFAGSGAALLAQRAEAAWSWCVVRPEEPVVRIRVVMDDDPDVLDEARGSGADMVGSDARRLMDRLSPAVTLAAIEHQAGRLLMFHAAGLAAPSGRTLVLVAPSGTGKTTAARYLGQRLGYVTDETLALRADGTIAPYPKPLSVIEPGVAHKSQVGPDEALLQRAPDICRVSAIVILERDGSAQPWLEPVDIVSALARLGPETSSLTRLDRPLHRLAEVVETAGGLRVLHYANAEQLLQVAHDVLEETG